MYIKKIRRKCGNRGCRNIENVYAISKTREMGNSIIICEECLRDTLRAIDDLKKPIEKEEKVAETPEPEEIKEETKPKAKQSKSK